MGIAVVEVSGPGVAQWAAELYAALAASPQPGDVMSMIVFAAGRI
jgi:hypothetical protein